MLSTATLDLIRSVSSLVDSATELIPAEAMLLHEPVQCRPIDAREPGGLGHVRAGASDQLRQILLLEVSDELLLREVEALGHDVHRKARRRCRRCYGVIVQRNVVRLNALSRL